MIRRATITATSAAGASPLPVQPRRPRRRPHWATRPGPGTPRHQAGRLAPGLQGLPGRRDRTPLRPHRTPPSHRHALAAGPGVSAGSVSPAATASWVQAAATPTPAMPSRTASSPATPAPAPSLIPAPFLTPPVPVASLTPAAPAGPVRAIPTMATRAPAMRILVRVVPGMQGGNTHGPRMRGQGIPYSARSARLMPGQISPHRATGTQAPATATPTSAQGTRTRLVLATGTRAPATRTRVPATGIRASPMGTREPVLRT